MNHNNVPSKGSTVELEHYEHQKYKPQFIKKCLG